ncbi:hypothetical protein HAZT_HAZT008404, partial [Hyalella azteca]
MYQRQVQKQGLSGAVVDAKNHNNSKVAFSLQELRDLYSYESLGTCITHDQLQCSCDLRGGPCLPPAASQDAPLRACQLRVGYSGAAEEGLACTMDRLYEWQHYSSDHISSLQDDLQAVAEHLQDDLQAVAEHLQDDLQAVAEHLQDDLQAVADFLPKILACPHQAPIEALLKDDLPGVAGAAHEEEVEFAADVAVLIEVGAADVAVLIEVGAAPVADVAVLIEVGAVDVAKQVGAAEVAVLIEVAIGAADCTNWVVAAAADGVSVKEAALADALVAYADFAAVAAEDASAFLAGIAFVAGRFETGAGCGKIEGEDE